MAEDALPALPTVLGCHKRKGGSSSTLKCVGRATWEVIEEVVAGDAFYGPPDVGSIAGAAKEDWVQPAIEGMEEFVECKQPKKPKDRDKCDREKTRRDYWRSVYNSPARRHLLSVQKGFDLNQRNLDLMRTGKAPQRENPYVPGALESLELHHTPVPCEQGGRQVIPVWPCEHAVLDPNRRPGYCPSP